MLNIVLSFFREALGLYGQVVRVAWLRCRKPPEGQELEPGLGHPTTGKLCLPSGKCVPVSNQGGLRKLI